MLDVLDDTTTWRRTRRIEALFDALRIMSRALAAVHYFETLRVASAEVLTRQGLTRSGVPRAVYRLLTGKA